MVAADVNQHSIAVQTASRCRGSAYLHISQASEDALPLLEP